MSARAMNLSLGIEEAIAAAHATHAGGANCISYAIACALLRGFGDKASTVAGHVLTEVHQLERNPERRAMILGGEV
jgi:hypothetical protein